MFMYTYMYMYKEMIKIDLKDFKLIHMLKTDI